MQIFIDSIDPFHAPGVSTKDFFRVDVKVIDNNKKSPFQENATITVFIKKDDIPLSEIKKLAIQQAKDFLSRALSDHSI